MVGAERIDRTSLNAFPHFLTARLVPERWSAFGDRAKPADRLVSEQQKMRTGLGRNAYARFFRPANQVNAFR